MPIEILIGSPQQRRILLWLWFVLTSIFFWPFIKSLPSLRLVDRNIRTDNLVVRVPFAWTVLVKGDYVQMWRPCRSVMCYAPVSFVSIERSSEGIPKSIWEGVVVDAMKNRPYTDPVLSTREFGSSQIACLEAQSTGGEDRIIIACYDQQLRVIAVFDGVREDAPHFKRSLEAVIAGH